MGIDWNCLQDDSNEKSLFMSQVMFSHNVLIKDMIGYVVNIFLNSIYFIYSRISLLFYRCPC